MQTHRIIAGRVDVDGLPVEVTYADAFVVLRDGATVPEPTDWEVQLRTASRHVIEPARHDLALSVADGSVLRGAAFLRFSDGHRHLLRGDSALDGFVADVPEGI